jgi:hypothetical protein
VDHRLAVIRSAVSVPVAAHELDVTTATVRSWLREGAPCASPGRPGNGTGARVVVEDVRRWRMARLGLKLGATAAALEKKVAVALLEVLERDAGAGVPLHRSLGVPEGLIAAVLLQAYQRVHHVMTGADLDVLPAEIEEINAVCAKWLTSNHRRRL